MTDGELRGVILQKFYDERHNKPYLDLREVCDIAPDETRTRIANICNHLSQHGLIEWRALGMISDPAAGNGVITARGVDVIEGTARPAISVVMHNNSITVGDSSHVQIGNANVQGSEIDIGKITAAINSSNASETVKAEAKSLLARIVENPLLQKAIGAIFGGSSGDAT